MKTLEIRTAETAGVAILYLNGYLDTHTAPHLERTLQQLTDSRRYNIIINFNGLSYIGSAGLGVLMEFIEDVRKNGGDIKLTSMSPKVYRVFDLLGFPALFDILGDNAKAFEKFGKGRHEGWWNRVMGLKSWAKNGGDLLAWNIEEILGGNADWCHHARGNWRAPNPVPGPLISVANA
jgi:anti-sigma B factor antagonist